MENFNERFYVNVRTACGKTAHTETVIMIHLFIPHTIGAAGDYPDE